MNKNPNSSVNRTFIPEPMDTSSTNFVRQPSNKFRNQTTFKKVTSEELFSQEFADPFQQDNAQLETEYNSWEDNARYDPQTYLGDSHKYVYESDYYNNASEIKQTSGVDAQENFQPNSTTQNRM